MSKMKKTMLSLSAAAMMASAMTIASPAQARGHGHYQDYRYDDYSQGRRDQRRYDRARYDDQRYYNNRRTRCDNGTGGLVIGAVAGGLVGNEVAGRGDKTIGTMLGAVVGGLAGQAIDKSDGRRCR